MVRGICLLLALLCVVLQLPALETVNVSAQVDLNSIYENQPIHGFVSITHDSSQKVDLQSFTIGKKPLKVEFYNEVKVDANSPLVVTNYQFEIPGMAKGLQLLPAISVNVGGKVYQSTPSTFEVHQGVQATAAAPPYLKLENFYEGASPLYPGQRARVGYRYLYNTNVELTEEYLPLLDAKGLRKIGDKDIKDEQSGNLSITQITQFVEATDAGEFKFGPSAIVGNAYVEDARHKRTYIKPPLNSEAPALTIVVKDFPADGKPASFKGAVGQFNFTVSMLTPGQVHVNDKIELKMVVSGTGQLENVQAPDLCCQPGFSGMFKSSDLPTVGKIEGNAKTFIVAIYPISTLIDSVPPIEFSYFNPDKKSYQAVLSPGIPIVVLPGPSAKADTDNEQAIALADGKSQALPSIEIEGNYTLGGSSLRDRFFGSLKSLLIIPLGFLLIFFQMAFKQDVEKKIFFAPHKDSVEEFKKAEQALQANDEAEFFQYLKKSFIALLEEKKLIGDKETPFEDLLSSEPALNLAKSFFKEIDAVRFSGKGKISLKKTYSEAVRLFKQIEDS